MSFANTNNTLTGRKPVPTASGGEAVAARFAVDLVTADLTLNNVGVVGILPAGHVPVSLLVDADDLDTNGTPTLVASIGILNAAGNGISTATADGGAAWGTGLTVAQAGGQVAVASKALSRVQASGEDRKIAVMFTTAAATAAAGQIGATLVYRPA